MDLKVECHSIMVKDHTNIIMDLLWEEYLGIMLTTDELLQWSISMSDNHDPHKARAIVAANASC